MENEANLTKSTGVHITVLGPLPPRGDPPVSAWERDIGLRRGARIAIDVAVGDRQGQSVEMRREQLMPTLRRLTALQHELVAQALDRSAAHRDRRMG